MKGFSLSLVTGCALALAQPLSAAPGDTAILILIDGVTYGTAADLMRQGKLPAMRELMRSKNGRLLRAVSSFPSSTLPVLRTSAATGNSLGARGVDKSLRPASGSRGSALR